MHKSIIVVIQPAYCQHFVMWGAFKGINLVKAFTKEKAQELLDKYNYHYLVLGDEIVAEIPCKPGTLEPDWNRMIDYEIIQNN